MIKCWWRTLPVVAAVAIASSGCIGKRRPQPREGEVEARVDTRVLQPGDVDDKLSDLVLGDRVQALYDENDPYKGAASPLVTIVEYSDFQCPFCSRLAGSLNQVVDDAADVRLVFKQYPLPMHKNAPAAAAASLAAHDQGKFWEMHDKLFTDQRALAPANIEGYAKAIGLDVDKFKTRMKAKEVIDRVKAETAAGSGLGVASTPTFFVNGRLVKGAKPLPEIQAIVAEERKLALQLLEAGAGRNEIYARIMKAAKPATPKAAPAKPDKKEPAKKQAKKKPEPPKPEVAPVEPMKPELAYAIPLSEDRPLRGPKDALVTIVEYGSMTCEACKKNRAVLAQVAKKHPGVQWAYRHLPGAEPEAKRAARALLAAHKQGKFWEMRDALLAIEGKLDAKGLLDTAKKVGLDEAKFRGDLQSPPLAKIIEDDILVANAVRGQSDAPIYFVNGRFLQGEVTAAQFTALIAEEKKKAKAWLKQQGAKRSADLYAKMAATWEKHDAVQAALKPKP